MATDLRPVAEAFIRRAPHACLLNTSSDGKALRLHGNVIAEWRRDGMWITMAGWPTRITMDRLSLIPELHLTDSGL